MLVVTAALVALQGSNANRQHSVEAVEATTPRYFRVLAVSPDERWLAYGITDSFESTQYTLYVRDLRSGTVVLLSRTVPVTTLEQGMQSVPAWAPSGQYLAYVDADTGKSRVRIWDRVSGTSILVSDAVACARIASCVHDVIHWSPDSRTVYFLGTERDTSPKRDLTLEEAGARVEGEVSVRTTASKRAEMHTATDFNADIYAYSLANRSSIRLTANGKFENFRASPNGSLILAARPGSPLPPDLKQIQQEYYLVRTKPLSTSSADPERHLAHVTDGDGSAIEPIITARQWQAAFSWSPGGKRVAFIESGGQTDGDVMLLDVSTGAVDVLTKGHPFGTVSDFDRTASGARHYGYPGTKFGSSLTAPVWSRSGSALLVSRVAMENGNRRTRLWRIDVEAGNLAQVNTDPACDLVTFALSTETSQVALLETCADKLRASMAGLEQPGVKRVASLSKASSQAFQFLSGGFYLAFESSVSPAEVQRISLSGELSAPLTSVNMGVRKGDLKAQTVRWTSSDGRTIAVPLYYLDNAARRPKLIIHIYPPDFFVYSAPRLNAFPARSSLDDVLGALLDRGYVVLERPNTMPAGGGRTCDRLGRDMDEALDAVSRTNLADTERAGIYGHSFGGYAVNCVITRTHRFKAAVSVSGMSDLISLHFTTAGAETATGGGQVGAMGGSLWDVPLRYWQESPVAGVRSVETPLLLIHGTLDRQVPVSQSREMFEGLSNLDKDVTLVEYTDADHGSSFTRSDDFKRRVINFFDAKLGR